MRHILSGIDFNRLSLKLSEDSKPGIKDQTILTEFNSFDSVLCLYWVLFCMKMLQKVADTKTFQKHSKDPTSSSFM